MSLPTKGGRFAGGRCEWPITFAALPHSDFYQVTLTKADESHEATAKRDGTTAKVELDL